MISLYYKIIYWFRIKKEVKRRIKENRKKDPFIYEE